MKIGYDGKRAFQNSTGLGNYARSLIAALAKQYPENNYTLFAPKQTALFEIANSSNINVVLPHAKLDKVFPSLWRRHRMVNDIAKNNIDIFHGVSNELPSGIEHISTKTVITVHDLIFERYPETYHWDERYTHRWKMKRSCKIANAVIAISEQTKKDLVDFYKIPAEKIFVCYQNCNPIFEQAVREDEKLRIKKKYQLPDEFFLFVSSITKRKNLLAVCKALSLLQHKTAIPLVVIGDGKKEKEAVKKYIDENGLAGRVFFLNELPQAKEKEFTSSADFPAIYQQALALVYPSLFEGFGIPLLEALWSRLPVISSNTSSLPEVAGDAGLYFSPDNIEALAEQMLQVLSNKELVYSLKENGQKRAKLFTAERHAEAVMEVYKKLL